MELLQEEIALQLSHQSNPMRLLSSGELQFNDACALMINGNNQCLINIDKTCIIELLVSKSSFGTQGLGGLRN